ncbi:nucleotidyltransferase [Clostridium sp. AF15-17LB]|nr:nucleotidyltransferase [Clostridium sp. AF15-17LB]
MGRATLVIMAAGIGSRFGKGIKQLEPVGPGGEIIMDYSIYDALEAGFDKVVFVIRRDLEKDFKHIIGKRIENIVEVKYAFQELVDIPAPFKEKFKERKKPWGTGQAVMCCKDVVQEPFAVINADDYYGKEAFLKAYHYLTRNQYAGVKMQLCMIGFMLKNTLSDNGGVTRGVCTVADNGMLSGIVETYNIKKRKGNAVSGDEESPIDIESIVSMNMWGLRPEFFNILETGFEEFLGKLNPEDNSREYLLPTIIGNLLEESKIDVQVLTSPDEWFGVTYKEDKDNVVKAINKLVDEGVYPRKLFDR